MLFEVAELNSCSLRTGANYFHQWIQNGSSDCYEIAVKCWRF